MLPSSIEKEYSAARCGERVVSKPAAMTGAPGAAVASFILARFKSSMNAAARAFASALEASVELLEGVMVDEVGANGGSTAVGSSCSSILDCRGVFVPEPFSSSKLAEVVGRGTSSDSHAREARGVESGGG